MIKNALRFLAYLAIWIAGCAIAELFPAGLNRCWLMLWGTVIAGVGTIASRLI